MSATDFLPRRQIDLLNWSSRFNNQIGANYEAYGLTFEQATEYNVVHNAYAAAFAMASSKTTNSTAANRQKRDTERALRRLARQIARQLKETPSVDRVARLRLGLTLTDRGGGYPPAPKPTTAPVVRIESRDGGRVKIRLLNTAEPSRRGRPRGALGALIMISYDVSPPVNPRDWSYVGVTGRTINTLQLPVGLPPDSPIWITARWSNSRHELGPLATAVPLHIQFLSNAPMKKGSMTARLGA